MSEPRVNWRKVLASGVILVAVVRLVAAADRPLLYVEEQDGFAVSIHKALIASNLPVDLVNRPEVAMFTLSLSSLDVEKQHTRAGVLAAKCAVSLWLCNGKGDKVKATVELRDRGGLLVWTYLAQGGSESSVAADIVRHLNNDFLKKAVKRGGVEQVRPVERIPSSVREQPNSEGEPVNGDRGKNGSGGVVSSIVKNEDVIKMVKAGLSDEIVLQKIASSPVAFDVSVDGLVTLKDAGVSDKVIQAILASNPRR